MQISDALVASGVDVKLERHRLEDDPMYTHYNYTTEHDLIVAEARFREFQAEMREIHLARELAARDGGRPRLLDRVVALVSRGAHELMPGHNVGAAA